MCALAKMSERGAKKCLEHPLSTLYLHIQCQRIKGFYILNIFLFFLYTALLVGLAFATKALMVRAHHGTTATATALGSEEPQEGDDAPAVLGTPADSSSQTQNLTTMEALETYGPDRVGLFWALFGASLFSTVLILLRELLQFRKSNYWNKIENWLELVMLGLALAFYTLIFTHPEWAIQVVSFTIIFAGLELTMLIGRHPIIGKFVFMSIYIIPQIVSCLALYFIVLLSFAIVFHLLMPPEVQLFNYFHDRYYVFKIEQKSLWPFAVPENGHSNKKNYSRFTVLTMFRRVLESIGCRTRANRLINESNTTG